MHTHKNFAGVGVEFLAWVGDYYDTAPHSGAKLHPAVCQAPVGGVGAL